MIRRLFSVLLLAGCSIVHLHAQQPVASPDSLSADSIVYTGSTGQVYQLSETAYKKIHAKLEEEVKKELPLVLQTPEPKVNDDFGDFDDSDESESEESSSESDSFECSPSF